MMNAKGFTEVAIVSINSRHYRIYFLVVRTNEASLNIQTTPFTQKS